MYIYSYFTGTHTKSTLGIMNEFYQYESYSHLLEGYFFSLIKKIVTKSILLMNFYNNDFTQRQVDFRMRKIKLKKITKIFMFTGC